MLFLAERFREEIHVELLTTPLEDLPQSPVKAPRSSLEGGESTSQTIAKAWREQRRTGSYAALERLGMVPAADKEEVTLTRYQAEGL